MTREIEFRGFSKEMNKWVYGGIHQYDGTTVIIHKQGINMSHMTEVDPETVGEYTGKYDTEGVKIFSGDKCKWKVGISTEYPKDLIVDIEYPITDKENITTYAFGYHIGDGDPIVLCDVVNLTVIGTIHD